VVGELIPGTLAASVPCWRQHFKREHCCEFHPNGFATWPEPRVFEEHVEMTARQKKSIMQMQRDYLAYLDLATEEWQALPREDRKRKALVTKVPIVRETRISQMTLAEPSMVPRPWKEPKAGSTPAPYVMFEGTIKQACDAEGFPLWDVIFAPDAISPKLDRLIKIWHRENEPIVAATNSQKFAELAVNRLNAEGIRAFEWSSSATEKQRHEAREAFIRGEIDIVVGVVEAIGTGIDGLQHAARMLVRMSKSRDLTSEIQLEGRLDRRGQEQGVMIYDIIAVDSIDQGIIDSQLEKRLRLNKSLRRAVGQKEED
jgi:hypothetical protein